MLFLEWLKGILRPNSWLKKNFFLRKSSFLVVKLTLSRKRREGNRNFNFIYFGITSVVLVYIHGSRKKLLVFSISFLRDFCKKKIPYCGHFKKSWRIRTNFLNVRIVREQILLTVVEIGQMRWGVLGKIGVNVGYFSIFCQISWKPV